MASPLDSLESPHTVGSMGTDSLSPYDSASIYANAFAQLHHNLDNGLMGGKQPPSYEESAATLQKLHALGLEQTFNGFGIPYRDVAHQVRSTCESMVPSACRTIKEQPLVAASSEADIATGADTRFAHSVASI